ncbi:MAG: DUF2339 domain-containing protein [Lachnospiraceae bacterium]|nr:DUF2339 domain-containing protein [Lachnospiraceae bacterium]
MTRKESDLLQFEHELLNTRQHLNSLIHEYADEEQNHLDTAIWQDKICYFETELKYLNNQLQILKNTSYYTPQTEFPQVERPKTGFPQMERPMAEFPQPDPVSPSAPSPAQPPHSPHDYEKIFGKNFMGIFASVLIFISLIIFATLMLPYLTDTIKLIGLYVVSFTILFAGYIPAKKNKANKFYTVLIGCGIGSLYISLLLSDLYFKVIGDIALYILILLWAVFIKYLPGLKNMLFHIIGQSGIFIATILGTTLCVHDADYTKFFVLTVFFFISAFVFSGKGRGNYALNLCNHICKALNLIVFAFGFSLMEPAHLRTVNIVVIMLYLLAEFYFSYKEEYRYGLIFQLLTIINSVTLICLFFSAEFFSESSSYVFMYIAAIALLFYIYKKHTAYEIISEIFFLAMIYLGCHNQPFIQEHLYAYLTVIPAMLYGKIRNRKLYLYTGLIFAVELFLTFSTSDHYAEYLLMTATIYLTFLFVCRTVKHIPFKISGYILISLIIAVLVHDSAYQFMKVCNMEHIRTIEDISVKANLLPFFILAAIHLILTALSYFGTEKPVEHTMIAANALLMALGCAAIGCRPWKPASIMITALLFVINSRKLLLRNQKAGYYIALKYTVFIVCVLNSYDVTNYIISITLLLFAITSIIIGFYKSAVTFRLYGLVLSMISIVKLIMIDIQYDSTIENAISFFVSGVLCLAISFIYHRIDLNLSSKKSSSSSEV